MSVTITSDLSQQVNWTVREKTDASLTLNCTIASVAADLTAYTYVAEFYKVGSSTPFLTLTQGSGITNGGASGVLTIALTDTQLTITPDQYFWKLRTTSPTDNLWFNGTFKVNDYLWDESSSSSASVALTIGTTTIDVAITLFDSALSTGTYSTELTFDTDKDIYQDLTGLSPTFTLAASGNINGKGIFLRLNKPTAVTFPVDGTFEEMTGDAFDATKQNVYFLMFFSNWNGAGLDHVVWIRKTCLAN